jgi:heat shock protein HslJ
VPNTVIRIGFHNGQISASAGCNTFGGGYRLDGDRLTVDGGAMTEMGCDQPRHVQDDWLFGFLGADPQLAIDGDNLVLTSADGTTKITLLDREVAEPDQPLTGRTWTLSSIITGETVSSVPAGIVANIEFMDDGSVMLNPGCNSAGGRYAVDGDSITFTDLATTDMACMGAAGQVEAAVLSVLNGQSVTFSIDAGTLTLMAGDLGLQFTAS